MLGSIRQHLDTVKTPEDLNAQFVQFEAGIDEFMETTGLEYRLDQDIYAPEDGLDAKFHATNINKHRHRIARFLSIAKAAFHFSKGFSIAYKLTPDEIHTDDGKTKTKKIYKLTRESRESFKHELSAPWEGLVSYLEETLKTIDSHVNMAKKILDESPDRAGRSTLGQYQ